MENIREKTGYLLNTSARLLRWEFNDKLKEYGLTTTQWAIIKDLHEQNLCNANTDNLTPAAISSRLQLDRPTVSGVIDRLTKQAFVFRSPNPSDRRSQIIHLTSKANELVSQLDELSIEVTEIALTGFSETEHFQLKNFLTRIISNLSSQAGKKI